MYGYRWISLDIFGYLWISLDIPMGRTPRWRGGRGRREGIWEFAPFDILGYLWISLDIIGFFWIALDIFWDSGCLFETYPNFTWKRYPYEISQDIHTYPNDIHYDIQYRYPNYLSTIYPQISIYILPNIPMISLGYPIIYPFQMSTLYPNYINKYPMDTQYRYPECIPLISIKYPNMIFL